MSNDNNMVGHNSCQPQSHAEIIEMLDAYSTNELEPNHQALVEQHLAHCDECQQTLAQIQQFHKLFRANVPILSQHYTTTSVVASVSNAILAQVKQKNKKRGQKMPEKIAGTFHPHIFLKKWSWKITLSVAVCFFALTTILVTTFWNSTQSSNNGGMPPPIIWQVQSEQTFARSSEGIFSVERIALTSKEFHFFYVFKSSIQKDPKVDTLSLCPTCNRGPLRLTTTVQPLGQIGSFMVGVIHASFSNTVGQSISLQITLPEKKTVAWKLDILKQLGLQGPIQPDGPGFFNTEQNNVAPVTFVGPVRRQLVAYFGSTTPLDGQTGASHVFLRLDDPITISVISQQDYLAIAGPENYRP
ncbi:MAG TPA: zf-HC2 domain-containing protein [Ktedonosporobacter sp.]|nr:zf-HC2 domain-containing protein [Ktedonosporobacter sp.]